MRFENPNRPWPVPQARWAMRMNWHELLFMHWPVPAAVLRPHVPALLDLDTLDGRAWLGIVPFRMTGVRPRLAPPLRGMSAFPEVNVRTYVRPAGTKDKPGVYFFSLDATNPIAVRVARLLFHLHYFDARISCAANGGVNTPTVHYSSRRTHRGATPAELDLDYRPVGPPFEAKPGTLEYFLTERYCLYAVSARGTLYRSEVGHHPWPLQPAEAHVRRNTMTRQLGFDTPADAPLLHYADYLEVVTWKPEMVVPLLEQPGRAVAGSRQWLRP